MVEDKGGLPKVESMQVLIQAFEKYMGELHYRYDFLMDAAEVCRTAADIDELRGIHMEEVRDALERLRYTSEKLMYALERLRVTEAEGWEVMNNMAGELKSVKAAWDLINNLNR